VDRDQIVRGDRYRQERRREDMPVPGINARQIEAFNKEYKASPQSFSLGLEAKSIWEGRGLGNLGKVGPWKLGTRSMTKPARDFSVQLGSWQEVGDALGVEGADDRIEPVEASLLALASCVTEAITLNCARVGVDLKALEVKTGMDVDPGPITGAKDPDDWQRTLKTVKVDVIAKGDLSKTDEQVIEDGAKRSPVHHLFNRAVDLKTNFRYQKG
jgi:uncharacterized OsmC-like protein